jgi:hypothetical protein
MKRCFGVALAVAALAVPMSAQQRGGGRGAAVAQTAQAQAPADLTGWWVSVVTEDWRWRMVTPKKGDYASLPINADARAIADKWDPAKDTSDGNACKAYGAVGITRMPTRLHITWQDDSTLKIDTDAGTQTRILRFGESPISDPAPSWQGRSKASWELLGAAGGRGPGGGGGFGGGAGATAPAGPPAPRYGSLKIVTDRMKPGYVRKNGVPYSANAVLTEYVDRQVENNGDVWITVTSILEDNAYFNGPYITSSGFKKEPDGSKFHAAPCSAQ